LGIPLLLSLGRKFSRKPFLKGAVMKKFAVRMIIALVVCALAGTAALGKVKSKTVSIGVDFVVGNTLVKKGTYKLSFDDQTNELTVIAKDKTVLAKAVAHLEKREKPASGTDIILAQKGDSQALVSIAFTGDTQNIVVGARSVETAQAR
jgi:hypothetical protein